MRFFLIALAVIIFLGLGLLYAMVHYGQSDMPSPARLKNIEPAVKTQIFDSGGRLVSELYRENRSYVTLAEIPQVMKDAVLSIEDRRFYKHWGLDMFRIFGAAFSNLAERRTAQGASTITQQLARNLFLTHEQTFSRKIKEQILALRIEQAYSKDEILELYLNQIYFGDGAYGVEAAAHHFLGKKIGDVSLSEAALLAGLPRNPRDYSPRRHPERAKQRRRIVLNAMLDNKVIDRTSLDRADAEDIALSTVGDLGSNAPYFVERVRLYLDEKYGSDAVYAGGLKVYTTLDLDLQKKAEEALEKQLQEVAKRAGHRSKYFPDQERAALEPGRNDTPYIQGAAMTIEARTGAIRMMIGGRDYSESRFNRAIQAHRQPGSTFKPFIYLAAIRAGHRPTETVMDEPMTYTVDGKSWSPQNYDPDFAGVVSLRTALQKSINVPAVKLLDEVGTGPVIEAARACGISSRIPPYLSIALGSAEVTLEELVYAYAVFANQGIRVEPYFVTRVIDRDGVVLEENRPVTREVMEAAPLYVLTNMLESVMNRGTGAPARGLGLTVPVAGKSGTTNDHSDAWFVGYTPDAVTAVWIGFDERKPIGYKMTGSVAALPAWTEIMKAAIANRPEADFTVPEGVVFRRVCSQTGEVATEHCPASDNEVFLSRYAPTEPCSRHGGGFFKRLINRFRSRDGADID
jgi:penicillin-binding protein 1A